MLARERRRAVLGLACALALGCGSSPAPHAMQPDEPAAEAPEPPPAPEPSPVPTHDAAERASTASYEEALAQPEPLDPNDARTQLSDLQLMNPMRDAVSRCKPPARAKVVVKVAVQMGRAIGVTVHVEFDTPKGARRRPSRLAAKREAKAAAKIAACVDRRVRALTWPPSQRRDSFTSTY